MSVRMFGFAIELPAFDQLLEHSLADLLLRVYGLPKESARTLCWDEPSTQMSYCADTSPALQSHDHDTSTWTPLTPDQLHAVPFLRQTAREHLNREDSYWLWQMVDALRDLPPEPLAREFTSGYRPLWIGSLLDAGRRHALLPAEEERRLSRLFGRAVVGLRIGVPPPEECGPPVYVGFPVQPTAFDPDVAVWDAAETLFALGAMERITTTKVPFAAPPGLQETGGYDEWVRGMVEQFLSVRDFGFREPNVLLVVGS